MIEVSDFKIERTQVGDESARVEVRMLVPLDELCAFVEELNTGNLEFVDAGETLIECPSMDEFGALVADVRVLEEKRSNQQGFNTSQVNINNRLLDRLEKLEAHQKEQVDFDCKQCRINQELTSHVEALLKHHHAYMGNSHPIAKTDNCEINFGVVVSEKGE